MTVRDFVDPERAVDVNVAGHATLMCAKASKLGERLDAGGMRLRDKDAGDQWRIMRCADLDDVTSARNSFEGEVQAGEIDRIVDLWLPVFAD